MDSSLTESLSTDHDFKPAEGWYYQTRLWANFVCCGISYVVGCFHRLTTAVLANQLVADLNVSKDDLGTLVSLYFWPYGVILPFVGSFADLLEPGFMIAGANLLMGIGSIIWAWAPSFSLACFGRFLIGLGAGNIFVPTNKIGINWLLPHQYSIMCGAFICIGGIGAILSQKPLAMLSELVSWRTILFGTGLISFIMSILSFLFVRGHPETLGYKANFHLPGKLKLKDIFLNLFGNLKEVGKIGDFWMLELYMIFAGCYTIVFSLWGVPFLEDVFHYPPEISALIQMALSLSLMLGSPLLPYIGDRLGHKKWTLFASTGVAVLACVVLIMAGTRLKTWMIIVCYFIYAGGAAGSQGIALTMFKEMGRPDLSASLVGCGTSGGFIGGALLQMISSSIIGTYGQHKHYPLAAYQVGLWGFCAMCGLVSMYFLVLTSIRKDDRPLVYPHKPSFSF